MSGPSTQLDHLRRPAPGSLRDPGVSGGHGVLRAVRDGQTAPLSRGLRALDTGPHIPGPVT